MKALIARGRATSLGGGDGYLGLRGRGAAIAAVSILSPLTPSRGLGIAVLGRSGRNLRGQGETLATSVSEAKGLAIAVVLQGLWSLFSAPHLRHTAPCTLLARIGLRRAATFQKAVTPLPNAVVLMGMTLVIIEAARLRVGKTQVATTIFVSRLPLAMRISLQVPPSVGIIGV